MTHVGQTPAGGPPLEAGALPLLPLLPLADVTQSAYEQMSCEPDAESVSKQWLSLTQRHSEASSTKGRSVWQLSRTLSTHFKWNVRRWSTAQCENQGIFRVALFRNFEWAKRTLVIVRVRAWLFCFFLSFVLVTLLWRVPRAAGGQRSATGVHCLAEAWRDVCWNGSRGS